MSVFQVRKAVVRYGEQVALRGVDLEVERGDRVALAGPSGAGKTTLLGLLNGTRFPTEGRVLAFGRDLAGLSREELREVQRRIGTVYQQFHLVGNLRVIHNVNAGRLGSWSTLRAAASLLRPLATARAEEELGRVGIGDKLYERTDRLSGGEQQRVAIARVLAQDPDVVLADEPISSLDRENSRRVMDLLRDLVTEDGKTLVASMHDIRFALSHFRRIVGLREGRVLFDAPARDVTDEMVETLYTFEGVPGDPPFPAP